jgi:Tol biopolymer transport system component
VIAAILAVALWPRPAPRAPQAAPAAAPSPLRIERLTYSGEAGEAAISPDGKVVVHAVRAGGTSSLWVRQVATAASLRIVPPEEGDHEGVTISPDGDYVYYVLKTGHQLVRALYRVPIFGGSPRQLIVDVDSPVTFSPDGKQLAFLRFDPFRREAALIIALAAGGGERRILVRPLSEELSSPSWSPDGRRLALASRLQPSARFGVLEVEVEGGAPRPIGPQSWREIKGLSWLRDGSGLAISASGFASRASQLWLLSYPAGQARRVTNDPHNYVGVSVAQDGGLLVSSRIDRVSSLWVADESRPSAARRVATGAGRYHSLAVAPDGRIVYSAFEGGSWDLWLADAEGGEPRRVTSEAGANLEPDISPDGRTIAFVSDRSGPFAVWSMDFDGGNPRKLTPGDGDRLPSFTPDGRWIVYTTYRGNKRSLWRVPVNGGDPVRVTRNYCAGGVVSPDGARVAARCWDERQNSPWRLAILSLNGGEPERLYRMPPSAELRLDWTLDGRGVSYVDHRGASPTCGSSPSTAHRADIPSSRVKPSSTTAG